MKMTHSNRASAWSCAFVSIVVASGCGARSDDGNASEIGGSVADSGSDWTGVSGAQASAGGTTAGTGGRFSAGGGGLAGTAPQVGAGSSAGGNASTGTVSAGGNSMGGTASNGGSVATAGTTAAPGTPSVGSNGYVTLSVGTTILSGYVSSYIGGSGSSISLSYTPTTFCASGTVGANATYNSWAGVGFNVNQAATGSSGSTGSLVLTGSTISISYQNYDTSRVELQLWDGSNYWCYYLPAATGPTTATVQLSSLTTQCWNNSGTPFTSGTAITAVQLVVGGNATTTVPFDYCFLGMTVK